MNPNPEKPRPAAEVERAAAEWVLRRDRGLTATEQDEFSQWLAADARHGAALAQQRWGWDELDRLTGLQTSLGALPDPDLFSPRRAGKSTAAHRLLWFVPLALAAAAAVVAGFYFRASSKPTAGAAKILSPAVALAAPCDRRTLEDGSVVELNRGAVIEVAFVAAERRVRLVRGEANFTVAKDAARPFVVDANGVRVRAVGTVFNVRLDSTAVEVLVSEGKVKVERAVASVAANAAPEAAQLVETSQRAVVSLAPAAPPPEIVTLTNTELEARLAWQPRLLDFTDAPLADIVAKFNQHNPVQLVIADSALAAVRLSASFRSDNVEGFVRLMESDFGMKSEWRGEKEIALSRAK